MGIAAAELGGVCAVIMALEMLHCTALGLGGALNISQALT